MEQHACTSAEISFCWRAYGVSYTNSTEILFTGGLVRAIENYGTAARSAPHYATPDLPLPARSQRSGIPGAFYLFANPPTRHPLIRERNRSRNQAPEQVIDAVQSPGIVPGGAARRLGPIEQDPAHSASPKERSQISMKALARYRSTSTPCSYSPALYLLQWFLTVPRQQRPVVGHSLLPRASINSAAHQKLQAVSQIVTSTRLCILRI